MWTSASGSRRVDVAEAVWSGFYYDGRTAHREPVRVGIAGETLQLIRMDGSVKHWPIAGLRQSQGAHGDRLRLEFGPEPAESLVVEGPGLAQAIQALVPSANPALKPPRNPWRAIGLMIVLLIALGAAYLLGAPLAARWLAPKVPVPWEQELGEAMVARLLRSEQMCTDSVAIAGVHAVLDRVLGTGDRGGQTFRLFVVNDTVVNAFAAPGGIVVVNAGLVRAAATPEELAMVLAHESQHILQRHSMRAVIREIPLRLALASFGDGTMGSAAAIGGTVGMLRYRRDDEREADVEGMRMLQRAQVDVEAAAKFMRVLMARGRDVPRFAAYLSSHPLSERRATELESMARASSHAAVPIMDDAQWSRVRTVCATR